jgi:hypothetical protein
MPLFNQYPKEEIIAIENGQRHPNWVVYRTPRSYYAILWALLFIPFFFILTTELWWTARIFIAGFILPLYHSAFYKRTMEFNITTTGFYMQRIPEKWSYVRDFYSRDMLKWIYSMYGRGFNRFIRFGFKLSIIFLLLGLGFGVVTILLPPVEFTVPLVDFVYTIPERYRYFFSVLNVFSADGASLEIVIARGYVVYNFKHALLTDWKAWYVLSLFIPLLLFYIFQMVFLGIRIYMLGSFLHHFGYWHHEHKPSDKNHPISNLLSSLIFSSFLYATLFMRLWAPVAVLLFFPAFAPQSPRYNYFKLMSGVARFFSIFGAFIFICSFLWHFLPVPMPELDRQIELWLNAGLIPLILIYMIFKLKGAKKNPNVEFEGLEKVKRIDRTFKLRTILFILVLIGIGILAPITLFITADPMYLIFVIAIWINLILFYIGWKNWGSILKKSIGLVEPVLPLLDDDKAHESDNHYWEGFSSGYFIITTLVMASLVFRRFSVYITGFAYLSNRPVVLMNFAIGFSLFMAYLGVWIYYWCGTKGIHSIWHVLTVLLQKIEISGPIPNLHLPEKEKYLEIARIYKPTIQIMIALFGIYYLIAGMILRALIVVVLFGVFGTLFVKMYTKDVETDYELITKLNAKKA